MFARKMLRMPCCCFSQANENTTVKTMYRVDYQHGSVSIITRYTKSWRAPNNVSLYYFTTQ